MGFRAPYLLGSAKAVATGGFDLEAIRRMSREKARAQLMTFPGVGGKIADCVLLFAYGYPDAFPVDVWVEKAIRRLYFQNRKVDRKRIEKFCRVHFGRNSGYAQQYLFHYMRLFHEEN